jgi:DNA gyrase subunit A
MVNRTHVSEIRVTGRNTQGVRVMGLREGDRIASLAKVAREEEIEEQTTPAEEAPSEAAPGDITPNQPPEPPSDAAPNQDTPGESS